MIFGDARNSRVFIRPGPTDMRKSINGLSVMAQQQMGGDPFDGSLFAFCNRRRNIIKMLYWDRNGFCLWLKRLEEDKFIWPRDAEECMELSGEQLNWLLRGLDFRRAHEKRQYTTVV